MPWLLQSLTNCIKTVFKRVNKFFIINPLICLGFLCSFFNLCFAEGVDSVEEYSSGARVVAPESLTRARDLFNSFNQYVEQRALEEGLDKKKIGVHFRVRDRRMSQSLTWLLENLRREGYQVKVDVVEEPLLNPVPDIEIDEEQLDNFYMMLERAAKADLNEAGEKKRDELLRFYRVRRWPVQKLLVGLNEHLKHFFGLQQGLSLRMYADAETGYKRKTFYKRKFFSTKFWFPFPERDFLIDMAWGVPAIFLATRVTHSSLSLAFSSENTALAPPAESYIFYGAVAAFFFQTFWTYFNSANDRLLKHGKRYYPNKNKIEYTPAWFYTAQFMLSGISNVFIYPASFGLAAFKNNFFTVFLNTLSNGFAKKIPKGWVAKHRRSESDLDDTSSKKLSENTGRALSHIVNLGFVVLKLGDLLQKRSNAGQESSGIMNNWKSTVYHSLAIAGVIHHFGSRWLSRLKQEKVVDPNISADPKKKIFRAFLGALGLGAKDDLVSAAKNQKRIASLFWLTKRPVEDCEATLLLRVLPEDADPGAEGYL